jgi:hypothetical protein
MGDFQTKLEGQGAGKVKEFPDVSCLSEMFRYDLIGLEMNTPCYLWAFGQALRQTTWSSVVVVLCCRN